MKNKLLSVLLSIAIVFTTVAVMSIPAAAAGAGFTVKEKSETASTVKVEIGLSGNTGYSGLGFDIAYDDAVLTPVSVEVAGPADTAMMTCTGMNKDSGYTVVVYGGDEVKSDGSVCVVTFKKNSSLKDGTSSAITLVPDADNCYDGDDNSIEVSSGSATLKLSSKTATTKKTTTKKTTTKSTTKKNKPAGNNMTNITVPTRPETTTEESTTLLVTEESTTEEYSIETYSYVDPGNAEAEDENADKSQMIKRIIAIAVIIVCVSAVAALIFTKKKSPSETKK